MRNPDWVLDLETTGLWQAFGQSPRRDVGISEWAMWSPLRERMAKDVGHTDILMEALKGNPSVQEYHKRLTTGSIVWQPGFGRRGDVLAGVHERHVAATRKAMASGKSLSSERSILKFVEQELRGGKSIGGWNVEFDMGQMVQTAERVGNKSFQKAFVQAFGQGRIVEMADPARRFLFEMAKKGRIDIVNIDKAARAKVASGQWSAADVATKKLSDLTERHAGFYEAIQRDPNLTYDAMTQRLASQQRLISTQSYRRGMKEPDFRFVRGWRQHVLAESINPGFIARPSRTRLGEEIGKRLNLKTNEEITAHLARDDTVLTEILHGIFSAKDPIKEMSGYGVKSEGQWVTQWKGALVDDTRRMLMTHQGYQSVTAYESAYLRKVLSGAVDFEKKAPAVAWSAAQKGGRFAGVRATARKALDEVKESAYKHKTATAAIGVIGAVILGDALVPQDNRLEGRRQQDSRYLHIHGMNFGGLGSPETHYLTDFGSGRSYDNASSQVRAWMVSHSIQTRPWGGYARAEVEQAQQMWGGALSGRRKRQLESREFVVKRAAGASIPGLNPDVTMGLVDLTNYRVKAEDADTISLYRRGISHLFEKPVSVRLTGIDAPEAHASWPFGMQPGGLQSGEYLQKLIDKQNSMKLLINLDRNTYGRHVGVLSGDVHPNMNLKLVSAGAAGALPNYKEMVNVHAFERAETIASAAGIGMWSSKGWQAKRMLDMAVTQNVTNTTLQNAKRLGETMDMPMYSDLVESLHRSPRWKRWEEGELDAISQVMAMRRKERMWGANINLKRYGWSRGKREPVSPWNIVSPGIRPTNLIGGNVSAFGSGRDDSKAEEITRAVAPTRREFRPQAEPIMAPPPKKTTQNTFSQKNRDRFTASRVLKPNVDTTPPPAAAAAIKMKPVVRPRLAPVPPRGLKPGMKAALDSSSAATAVHVAGPTQATHGLHKYMGAAYSAGLAYKPPYRPANEYQVLQSMDFPSNWQEKVWHALKSGQMMGEGVSAGESGVIMLLQRSGFKRQDALDILRRYGISKYVNKIANKDKYGDLPTGGGLLREFMGAVASGETAVAKKRFWMFAQSRMERITGRESSLSNAKDGTLALIREVQKEGIAKTFRHRWSRQLKEEWKLRKVLWNRTVGKGGSVLGKVGGMMQFLVDVGDPIRALTPNEKFKGAWEAFKNKASDKKIQEKALREAAEEAKGAKIWGGKMWERIKDEVKGHKAYIFGDDVHRAASVEMGRLKSYLKTQVRSIKGAPRFLHGTSRMASRIGGPLGILMTGGFAIMGASQYENSALGFGLEAVAGTASFLAWEAMMPLTTAAGQAIGGVAGFAIGGAIGAIFGGGAGAAPGAGIGEVIGSGLGYIAGIAAALVGSMVVHEGMTALGSTVIKKRNTDPNMMDPNLMPGDRFGPSFSGMSYYGGTDRYLSAGHGIQGRPAFSGFGGGLKPVREKRAIADTLSKTSPKHPAGGAPPAAPRRLHPKSRLQPTAGLTNFGLWDRRHGITRGRSRWPVTMERPTRPVPHPNGSRMMRAA